MKPKENTQRQRAIDFYNSYEGEKVTFPTFYWRVCSRKDLPWEEIIKTKCEAIKRRRNDAPKGKRAQEFVWYNEQPEPRASKSCFRNRLASGYTKEQAILIGDEREKVKQERKQTHPIVPKTYIPKRKMDEVEDENNFLIKVTYPKEVARIFRREYVRMIEEIEWELTYTSEKTEIVQMNKKLESLNRELIVFNYYNK